MTFAKEEHVLHKTFWTKESCDDALFRMCFGLSETPAGRSRNSQAADVAPEKLNQPTQAAASQTPQQQGAGPAQTNAPVPVYTIPQTSNASQEASPDATAVPSTSPSPSGTAVTVVSQKCPDSVSWGGSCGQNIEPAIYNNTTIALSSSGAASFKNTKAGFEGTARLRCNLGVWLFVDGSCSAVANNAQPSPSPSAIPCTPTGVSPQIVSLGSYQNCPGGSLPSVEFKQASDEPFWGCCQRVKRVCNVSGFSTQNPITCEL